MRSPLRIVLAVLVTVVALSACDAARPPAAVVDGRKITDAELRDQIAVFTFLSSLSRQPCGQRDASIGETQQAACARFTLANLIQEDLVEHYAAAHHITLQRSDVTDAISQLESSLGGAQALDRQLRANGVTRAQLEDLASRLLVFSKASGAIGQARTTDEQLRALYEQQKAQFTQIHAKHILVKTRAEANRIAAEATRKNFASLAEKYSTDTASAKQGGDLGTIPASSLDPDFVEAALSMSPGQISGPVHTRFGWHVIMLVSADVQPFDQVRDQLQGSLQNQAFGAWLQQRLASADISVNPKYGRLDAKTGEIVPIRSTEAAPSASPRASTPAPAASP